MAFTCQTGRTIKNHQKCEHCGATAREICGRLPTVMQETINDLVSALEDILDYSGGAEGPLNDDYVVDRAKAAIEKAKRVQQVPA